MSLAILIPVLARPQNVRSVMESIQATVPDATVLWICDPGDIAEQSAIAQVGGWMISPGGNYAQKINAGVRTTTEDWLFIGADDLHFHDGWWEAVQATAEATGASVIGTQDLCNARVIAGEHATHFAMARWYAEEPTIDSQGGPLFEGYLHEFVDDELIGTARKRGTYAFATDAIVEHLHPNVGKAPMDYLYAGQQQRMRKTRGLYERRRALWT